MNDLLRKRRSSWRCTDCGEEFVGKPAEPGKCFDCAIKAHAPPRPSALVRLREIGVPDLPLTEWDVSRLPGGQWPRHPASSSPEKSRIAVESLDWGDSKTLLLYGRAGIGKSRAAAELCRIAMDAGMSARWWRCADLVGEVVRGQVNACRLGARFVVLDDIGRGVSAGVGSDILDQAILSHYEAWGAKLVLTSNKGPAEVYSKFSAATGDRIAGGLMVHMAGETLRGSA